jgi:hypothetical protein
MLPYCVPDIWSGGVYVNIYTLYSMYSNLTIMAAKRNKYLRLIVITVQQTCVISYTLVSIGGRLTS